MSDDWKDTLAMLLGIAAIIMAATYCARAKADHEEAVHWAAHVGASYTATMIGYGISKAILGKEFRPFTILTTSATVLIAGALYDAAQPNKGASFIRNVIGIGAAAGTIMVFDF